MKKEETEITLICQKAMLARVDELNQDIARLEKEVNTLQAGTGKDWVRKFWPFSEKDEFGVWDCRSGVYIGDAELFASSLAKRLGQSVYFIHNGKTYTAHPKRDLL